MIRKNLLIWVTVISSVIFVIQLASLQLSGDSFDRALNELRNMPLEKIISQRFTFEYLPLAIENSAKAEGIKFVIGPND